jgi:predicted metalloenzyme YecM
VNRGFPFSWAIERHVGVVVFPLPAVYPFNFQALNFLFDLISWATVLLLPSCAFLYAKGSQIVVTSRAWDGVVTLIPSRVQQQRESSKGIDNQVTLYVKSNRIKGADRKLVRLKTIVTLGSIMTFPYPWSSKFPYYDVERITHFDYVLPKDQQEMMENVKELSLKNDFKVEVVDVGKMNVLSRSRLKHSEKIETLPATVTDSGEIFEGVMTKQQIETYFFKAVKGT